MLTYTQILTYAQKGNNIPPRRVEKTKEEWQQILTPEQFQITREKGTESRMSSKLCTLYEPGIYACVCCDTPLFDSATKYESSYPDGHHLLCHSQTMLFHITMMKVMA